MEKITINSITWGHSRGYTPLIAAAQRYNELHPHIEINWKKRSLQEFADYPIEKLVDHYDLLIIDHPWVGTAAATGCVLPLNEYLPTEYLQDQRDNSVGYSHLSYEYEGKQWALAIDAATPAASYRADLFQQHGQKVPDTWEELLALAEQGKVAIPGIPVDLIMNFYMFCVAVGEEPFRTEAEVVSTKKGVLALQLMKQLWGLLDKEVFDWNPIKVAEVMTTTDKYWYCPFAYCYSNYSRDGYAAKTITYADIIRFGSHGRMNSSLGGTGLSISASTRHIDACVDFAKWIVSPQIQQTFYLEHGGQPGHRSAWTAEKANLLTNNYFHNLLPTLDRAYVRPRYHGYLHFQDKAGDVVRSYLMQGDSEEAALEAINKIYKESLLIKNSAGQLASVNSQI